MGNLLRIVLDVLKPLEPNIVDMVQEAAQPLWVGDVLGKSLRPQPSGVRLPEPW